MILISHRGNTNGPNPARENDPVYIGEALTNGYDVEIDVWYKDGEFRLGHDAPQYAISEYFLENGGLWCHAKNLTALQKMLANKKIHCFSHQNDDFALTSRGIIWTFPGREVTPQSVCVMPEWHGIREKKDLPECFGVCSDSVANFK